MTTAPSVSQIETAAEALSGRIVATPTVTLNSTRIANIFAPETTAYLKLELFQQAGSFKSRGVLLAIDAMTAPERAAGVTAVSAGNHALAVSWGAQAAGLSAKVVMPKTADPIRVEGCKALGAEVVLADNVSDAFAKVDELVASEGRTMLHPFESPFMTLGAATCGLEFARTHPDMEAAIIPVGGGGFISGMASAIKTALPDCTIYGVEPFGADSMWQSFQTGQPVKLDSVTTIADSLGAPMALPQSFSITAQYVDKIVRVEDAELCAMMESLFHALKLVAEPACAASAAALAGPLRATLAGKKVGIVACGSNISVEKHQRLIKENRSVG